MNSNLTTKKQAILDAFERMDTDFLLLLLDDKKSYNDATKHVFLEKLEEVYDEFKEQNDTSLYRVEGQCISDECPNKGKCGYAFVGRNSGKHLDLIFEEDDTGYKDIYYCSNFKSDDIDLKALCQYNDFVIRIASDETAKFVPTPSYLIRANKCAQAYDELYQYGDEIIHRDIYEPWLARHRSFFDSFGMTFLVSEAAYKKFVNLYNWLDEIAGFLSYEMSAKLALAEYKKLGPSEETAILQFFIRQEDLIDAILAFDFGGYPDEEGVDPQYYMWDKFKFSAFDYLPIHDYRMTIVNDYYRILEKYRDNIGEEEKMMEMRLEDLLRKSGINSYPTDKLHIVQE